MVVVKDISRFARNTVDLLQSVRKLKSLGIETQFLTANMTSMGNSEFVLTIFGALAQEESANTSKRIKFGKKMNAEKGRVPNIVYGYDKTIGDYFNLSINENEAKTICQIFQWYTEEGYGASKIANMLNEHGIKTKRGNNWSQNAICRILTNEIYTGKIINGKEEIADFLTGQRKEKDESEWLVTVRQYKNTYVRWVCSGHNGKGADSCPNAVTVDEEELIQALQEYFQEILSKKKKVINYVIKEFQRVYKAKDENIEYEKQLIPMVMVNGTLYLATGHESKIEARCGVMDGEITSQVDGNKQPSVDDQSNFGTGYGYQYGATEGTIELFMNGKWWIFATEEARQKIQMAPF